MPSNAKDEKSNIKSRKESELVEKELIKGDLEENIHTTEFFAKRKFEDLEIREETKKAITELLGHEYLT